MRHLPKINQLKNLRAIIQHGSIRSAAEANHQTQSAMTRSIQELEKTASELEQLAAGASSQNSATDYLDGILEKVTR